MGLILTRRFLPLFVTQFLGAFNDNLFKTAMVMLVTFRFSAAMREPSAARSLPAIITFVPRSKPRLLTRSSRPSSKKAGSAFTASSTAYGRLPRRRVHPR